MELKDFIQNYVECTGGIASQEDGTWEIILADGKYYKEDSLSYGSPLLDKFISDAMEIGETTKYYISTEIKKKVDIDYISRYINFPGVKLNSLNQIIKYVPVGIFNFRVSYLSDDKKEEVKTLIANLFSNKVLPDYNLELCFLSFTKDQPWEELKIKSIDEVYEKVKSILIGQIQPQILEFEQSLSRKLTREINRIKEYYQTNEEELKERLNKLEINEQRRKNIMHKIEVNKIEQEKKLKDIEFRYSLEVKVKLVNLAIVNIPMIECTLNIVGREGFSKDLTILWDSIHFALEKPVCEICGNEINSVYFCSACGKTLCASDRQNCCKK